MGELAGWVGWGGGPSIPPGDVGWGKGGIFSLLLLQSLRQWGKGERRAKTFF